MTADQQPEDDLDLGGSGPTTTDGIPDIRIAQPEGWSELDLDPHAVDEMVTRLFAELDQDDPDDAPLQRQYELQIRATFERARQQGAVAMLQFLAKTEDEPRLLAASLLILVRQLAAPLLEMAQDLDQAKEIQVLEFDDTPTVRVSHLSHALLPGLDSAIPMHTVRYYQEIEGTPLVAALAFSTPNVPLAEEFTGLFDDMVSTFSITPPTPMGSNGG